MRRMASPGAQIRARRAATSLVASGESVSMTTGHSIRRSHEPLGPDQVGPHLGQGLAARRAG